MIRRELLHNQNSASIKVCARENLHAILNLTETKVLRREYTRSYDKEEWHPTEG